MVLLGHSQLMPSFILASTAGLLLATDVPLPVELTAMGMVGTILLWLIRRENQQDTDTQVRLTRLEATEAEQRHLKHALLNRLAGLKGSLLVVKQTAENCSCGAMHPVLPLLEELVAEEP